jgi:16S rRNA (guanine966-N2)-methyltransferase
MKTNQLRIIGGKWRGRKLSFPDVVDLRPTTDRIRETVFNWLMADIVDAECLDLFAGSGALGFEALSRGAKQVTFIDQSSEVINQLKENAAILKAESQANILQQEAIPFLNQQKKQLDIIFLDPPFKLNIINELCQLIAEKKLLKPGGLIYIEMNNKQTLQLPAPLSRIKQKQAGQVIFCLAKMT